MRCNAWNPPGSCYNYVAGNAPLNQGGCCPSALWFWVLAGLAGVYALTKR